MTLSLTALFFLGMSVSSRTQVQAENVSKPKIWVEPGSVIPLGTPVNIWCQGIQNTKVFHLQKKEKSESRHRQSLIKFGDKTSFSIPYMTDKHTGEYCCHYLTQANTWSENSDTINLVVTGSYDKPYLSAWPSPVVTSGENVTLQCHSGQNFDRFILIKEGELKFSRNLESQSHSNKHHQALFPVGPVTLCHKWTFRCYGYYRKKPSVWSYPSDPLELLVSGATGIINPSQIKPDCSNSSHLQDYTMENIIRLSMAGLILLVLGILLLEAYHSQKKDQKTARTQIQRKQILKSKCLEDYPVQGESEKTVAYVGN